MAADVTFGFQGMAQALLGGRRIDLSTLDALWARGDAGKLGEEDLHELGTSTGTARELHVLSNVRSVAGQASDASFQETAVKASFEPLPGAKVVRAAFEAGGTSLGDAVYRRCADVAACGDWLQEEGDRELLGRMDEFREITGVTASQAALLRVLELAGKVERVDGEEWRRRQAEEEQKRLAAEAEARRIEEERRAEEARVAEEKRRAEEARLAEERRVEEERRAQEERRAEEARIAEEKRLEEEARLAAEAEARRIEERRAEEARLAEERRLEEERRAEEARRVGAADTLAKPGAGLLNQSFGELLVDRVRKLGRAARVSGRPERFSLRPEAATPIEILGIGSSTGGLRALASFFASLPTAFDAPILVTQHLPPTFMPFFAEQLSAMSGRFARVAGNGDTVGRGSLFVAPGDAHLAVERVGARLSIALSWSPAVSRCCPSVDPMLTAIGTACGEGAVGVVLTGMGRDGVEGCGRSRRCGRIGARAGSRQLCSMGHARQRRARGARERGRHTAAPCPAHRIAGGGMSASGAVRVLSALIETRTGQQLSPARAWRIEASLKPLLKEHGLNDLDALVGSLASGRKPQIAGQIVDALLNNETSFFRDASVFEQIDRDALEVLRESRSASRRLRIWSAACSTGQEAYSLAIMLSEANGRWAGWTFDILATDISSQAVERAKAGRFSRFEIQRGLPVRTMLRWFREEGEDWVADPSLRRDIRLRTHDIRDAAPGRFDLILCRNVLMYFPVPSRAAVRGRQLWRRRSPAGQRHGARLGCCHRHRPAGKRRRARPPVYPDKRDAGRRAGRRDHPCGRGVAVTVLTVGDYELRGAGGCRS